MLATFRRCRTVKPVSQFLHHSVNMAFCARAISLRRTSGARRNVRSSRARRLKALILTASGQSRSIVPISHSIWPRRARNGATLVALRLEAERFCVIELQMATRSFSPLAGAHHGLPTYVQFERNG